MQQLLYIKLRNKHNNQPSKHSLLSKQITKIHTIYLYATSNHATSTSGDEGGLEKIQSLQEGEYNDGT